MEKKICHACPDRYEGCRLDWFKDVVEFHLKFGHHIEDRPKLPPSKESKLRHTLIEEEMKETLEGIEEGNLAKIADGIADSIVVLLGTGISYGIDVRPIWNLVHESNMKKGGGGTREDGKTLKPEGWKPPNIDKELRRQQDAANSH